MDSINGFVWSKKQKVSDASCWTCHRSESTLFCASCVRSFHESPVCSQSKKMNAEAVQTWCCPECCAIEKDEQIMNEMQLDTDYVNKVLKFVMDLLLADEYLQPHFREIDYSKSTKSVAYAIDLLKMSKKVDNNEYRCWDGFFADITWIVHNTKAYVHPPKPKAACAQNWLMKFTRDELQSIRLCHECYVNANEHPDEWFSMVCSGNHPVVWAKLDTYPYWPAKLMDRNKDDGTVDIHFFGDNSRATIPSNKCTKYSEMCPSSNLGAFRDAWNEAQAAAKVYIDKLIAKCGREVMLNPNIPKPIPTRRLTISGHDFNKPRSPAVASARILNRRSTNVDHSIGKTDTNIIDHQRQRVTFGRIKSTNQRMPTLSTESNSKSVFKVPKAIWSVERIESLKIIAKKRKLDQDSDSKTTKLDANDVMVAGQTETCIGKNEVQSKSTLPVATFDPKAASYQSNAPAAAPELPRDNMVNQSRAATPSAMNQFSSPAKSISEMESDDNKTSLKPSLAMFVKSSPELMAKCENIVKDAMQNYAELTRTSFETIVLGLLNKHENQLQTMKANEASALESQRLDYDGIIETIRAENHHLIDRCAALKAHNAKLMSQNAEATNADTAAKTANDKLKAELEVANGKIVGLHSSIKELVNQNGVLNTKVGEVQKLNAELSATEQILHQKLQRTMAELQKATQQMASNGREFHQFCEELKTKFQVMNGSNGAELSRLREQNQWQANQIQHMRSTFEVIKRDAIAQTKKLPWCQGCGNPGDPYYCTRCRIQRIPTNQYFPSFGQQSFGNRRM